MEKSDTHGLKFSSKSFDIVKTKNELEKSKTTYKSVNLSKLPDKGAKLKNRILELENLLESLSLEADVKSDECEVNNSSKLEKNDAQKSDSAVPIKSCDSTSGNYKSDNAIIEFSESKENVSSNASNPLSFGELAAKQLSKSVEENAKSPSFTGWREPGKVRKTFLTEAKRLETEASTSKTCLPHHFNSKPLFETNEESVKKIQHSLVTYPDNSVEESDPETMRTSLMMHQRRALAWLLWREKQDPSGGILADDMGLGKTLTIISLILKQKEENNYFAFKKENNESKASLIICLASIIHQWKDEIEKHCDNDALDVLLYHGPKRERSYKNMMKYDVVLTTYNIVMAEKKAVECGKTESPLFKLKWERIVLDEAHTIKNHNSQTAEAIFSLKAFRKWAVTGTPIHNVFKDVYSLVKFLQFSPFDDYKKFKKLTDDFSESSETRKNLLIKSIVLRRTKQEADETGKPIITMKNKSFSICYIELTDKEREIYDKLNDKVTKKFDQYFLNHSKMKSNNLLVLLLRLQQCCSHTNLLGKEVEDDDISSDITKTLSSLSIDSAISDSSSTQSSLDLTLSEFDDNISDSAVKSSKIKKLFEDLNKISEESGNSDKSVIVSQWVSMLDIVAFHLKQEGIRYHMIAGDTKAEDRQKFAEDFNTKDRVKIMLLSLKAGGVGLNLVGANHLFLLDLHWNPALEMQASDRIHRVGQKKDVLIHKFICKNTIEEKIQSLQDSKRHIASNALHGVKKDTKGMTLEDFRTLFSVKT